MLYCSTSLAIIELRSMCSLTASHWTLVLPAEEGYCSVPFGGLLTTKNEKEFLNLLKATVVYCIASLPDHHTSR